MRKGYEKEVPEIKDGFSRRMNLFLVGKLDRRFIFEAKKLLEKFPIPVPKSQKDLGTKKTEVKSHLFLPNDFGEEED